MGGVAEMLVSIFTDAGLCPETHCASWAVWCKSERGVSRGGGILRAPMPFSTLAESAAAVNGIHHAVANGIARHGDVLLIQTDNNDVGNCLTRLIKPHYKSQDERRAMQRAYFAIMSKYDLKCSFRHVAGHNGTRDKRSAVNTWCDKVCTFFLKMARHEAMPDKWGPVEAENAPYGVKITA